MYIGLLYSMWANFKPGKNNSTIKLKKNIKRAGIFLRIRNKYILYTYDIIKIFYTQICECRLCLNDQIKIKESFS